MQTIVNGSRTGESAGRYVVRTVWVPADLDAALAAAARAGESPGDCLVRLAAAVVNQLRGE